MLKIRPRLTAFSLVAVALAGHACQQTSNKAAKDPGTQVTGKTAVLEVELPGLADFPLSSGSAADHLKVAVYRLTASDRRCADYEVYELHDFPEKGPLELEVSDACDYEFEFAVGKAGGDEAKDLIPYYRTAEPAFIDGAELKDEGEATIRLHLKRAKPGTDAGFTATWVKAGDTDNTDLGDDVPDGAPAYEPEVRELLARRCTSCHAVGASRPNSPLTTFAEVKVHAAAVVTRAVAKSMPPANGAPLSDVEIKVLSDWQAAGFPETKAGTGAVPPGTVTPGGTTTSPTGEIEFRIKAGTGNGAWNTAETSANFKVGNTLRIYNDDTVNHQLHTNGSPCPHGGLIRPGAFEDCKASRPYTGQPLYDHNTNGQFFLRVTQ